MSRFDPSQDLFASQDIHVVGTVAELDGSQDLFSEYPDVFIVIDSEVISVSSDSSDKVGERLIIIVSFLYFKFQCWLVCIEFLEKNMKDRLVQEQPHTQIDQKP